MINKSLTSIKSELNHHFSHIQVLLEEDNINNRNNFSVDLEDWLIPILNISLDSNFKKQFKINAPAIDLIDQSSRIAIQITSTKSKSEKIQKTLVQFYKHNYHSEYDKLYILFMRMDHGVKKFDIEKFYQSEKFNKLEKKQKENLFNPSENIIDFHWFIARLSNANLENYLVERAINTLESITGVWRDKMLELESYLNKSKSINESLEELNPEESVKFIQEYFTPFIILPESLLCSLLIFDSRLGDYIENQVMYSSNTKFFNYIDGVNKKNIEEELTKFLLSNNIKYIVFRSGGRIKLQNRTKNSHCNICALLNLKYNKQESIPENISNDNYLEFLNNFFINVEYGFEENAIKNINDLLAYSKERKGLVYFHTLYNLKRFFKYYTRSEKRDKTFQKYKELKEAYYSDFWTTIYHDIDSKEARQIVEYILNYKHIDDLPNTIKQIDEVENIIEKAKNGKVPKSPDKIISSLILELLSIEYKTLHNRILFDLNFSNFSSLIFTYQKKISELIRYSEFEYPKISQYFFSESNLLLIFKYLDELKIKKLLVSLSLIKQNNDPSHIENIHNFCLGCIDKVLEFQLNRISIYHDKSSFHGISDTLNNVVNNISIFYTSFPFSDNQKDDLVKAFLKLLSADSILWPVSKGRIGDFINTNFGSFDFETKSMIKLSIESVPEITLTSVNQFEKENYDISKVNDFGTLNYLYSTDDKFIERQIVRNQILDIINAKFDFWECRAALLNDIVEYDQVKDELIKYLRKMLSDDKEERFKLFNNYFESHFLRFIEVLYYKKLETKDFLEFAEENEYLKWLLTLDTYDINNFIPVWTIKFDSHYFYNEFKNHKYIKNKIEEFLSETEHGKLANVYFNYLIDA